MAARSRAVETLTQRARIADLGIPSILTRRAATLLAPMTPPIGDGQGEVDGRPFGELLAEFRPRLRRMVTFRLDPRLSPRIDASDVIQETFVEVARRIENYRASAEMPFFLWVRQIAHQKVIDLHRMHMGASKRDVRREGGVPGLSSSVSLAHALTRDGSTPSRIAVRAEEAENLREALEDMREIDHLLQKASRPETEGLLVAATETQGKVIRGIDDMLAQLHEVCCTCPGGG